MDPTRIRIVANDNEDRSIQEATRVPGPSTTERRRKITKKESV